MKEHTLYALQSRYTSSAKTSTKYHAKHMFSYLDFRRYFEANGQNHIHFWLIQALMIAVPCKEPIAGGTTGAIVDFIDTRRLN